MAYEGVRKASVWVRLGYWKGEEQSSEWRLDVAGESGRGRGEKRSCEEGFDSLYVCNLIVTSDDTES